MHGKLQALLAALDDCCICRDGLCPGCSKVLEAVDNCKIPASTSNSSLTMQECVQDLESKVDHLNKALKHLIEERDRLQVELLIAQKRSPAVPGFGLLSRRDQVAAYSPLDENEFRLLRDQYYSQYPDKERVNCQQLRVYHADKLLATLEGEGHAD